MVILNIQYYTLYYIDLALVSVVHFMPYFLGNNGDENLSVSFRLREFSRFFKKCIVMFINLIWTGVPLSFIE